MKQTKQVERKTKKWLKRKGCKNCALVWHELPCYEDCDDDCEGHGIWEIEPYYKGKEFRYVSKVYNFQQTEMQNVYFDSESKLVVIKDALHNNRSNL